jgi:serine/threonine protein kinase/WD40 repeat protein/Tfp pilus assembly protein PilF
MTDPELRRNPVEILAEEFLDRYRRGERPTLTEYVDRHPELSGEIREIFPALLAIEEAGPHPAPRHASLHADGSMPERLGEFRIVGEIGRGGMGVVYEAIQESLGRHVALKILPLGAMADPAALKRFRREARSVAALHHSNIVPVFGIGEHAGHHYYAMQLIRGRTLEAVLGGVCRLRDLTGRWMALPSSPAERDATEIAGRLMSGQFIHAAAQGEGEDEDEPTTDPTGSSGPRVPPAGVAPDSEITTVTIAQRGESQYHRRIARIGLQVAEALGYAHDQGVLHRDIKPSNLLMDDAGTVWVLDFGLAKSEAAGEQSASRDIVGTLRYMAPERFDGRSDRRSDVYGLGVTLYELLTLRPAFDDGQQSALIHQILHGAATSPRYIDRRIPRDLETIVLKAMAREPSARYASAHALGEDLRRFLENRTILARRSTSLERTSRWCRRNPLVAALLTSVVVLLAFIAGYYSVAATQYRHQFERAHAAEIDGREKLFTSYVAQARASRFSRRPGQRFAALRALAEAAKIRRTPELRDEAIACLALPDLDEIHRSPEAFRGIRLAFDPNLEHYAALDWDGVVSVRRVADDREVRRLPSPGPVPDCFILAFSPDGRHLAVSYRLGSSRPLKVWRLDRGEPVFTVDGPAMVCAARFTPDGLGIALAHTDGSLVFHDLASGLAGGRRDVGNVGDLAFSPDGQKLAMSLGSDPPKIKICAVPSGKVVREISPPAGCTLAWAPDGSTLAAACEDTRIYSYDAQTGRQTGVLVDHRSQGMIAAFQPGGSLLASNGWDGKLRIWRLRTGEMLLSLSPAGGAMDFRRDGLQFASQAPNGAPVLFQVADGREFRSLVRSPARRQDYVLSSAIHPNGRLLAVGMSSGVGFWDIDRDVAVGSLPIGTTRSLLFEPSGDLVTMGRTGLARWPVHPGHDDPDSIRVGPPDLLMTTNGENIAGSRDGRILAFCQNYASPIVIDRDRPKARIRLEPHADVRYITVSPDGHLAATGSHNNRVGIAVWSLPDVRCVKRFPNAGLYAKPLFSPDGRWLATNMGNEVRLWTVGEWREGPRFEGGALCFSPDGRLLAIAQQAGSVGLVEAETGRLVASLDDRQQTRAGHATFSADGSRLILTGEQSHASHAWDLRTIRRGLAAMDLDWDWPSPPGRNVTTPTAGPLRVATDLGGHDFAWGGYEPQEVDRLNEALEIDPGDLHAMLRRARISLIMGRHDRAIADYTRAAAISPGDRRILAARGAAYLSVNQYAPGFADCEAAIAAEPDQALLRNSLAWAYVSAPAPFRNPAKALTHAQSAVRLSPEIAIYHNTLGVTLYRLGRYRDAVIELETSLATTSRKFVSIDLYFLAMCQFHLGDTDKAKAHLERARGLHDESRLIGLDLEENQVFRVEAEALLGNAAMIQALPRPR